MKNRKYILNTLKILIIVLSLGNLAALFIFHYEMPAFLKTSSGTKISDDANSSDDADNSEDTDRSDNADRSDETDSSDDVNSSDGTADSDKSMTDAGASALYSFKIDSDTLTYDGNGKLDLLSGVSVVTPDDSASEPKVFAHVKTGGSASEKVIEYTADTPDGQIKATRTLKLTNYKRPSIKLPDALPQLDHAQLDSILAAMPSDGSFYADDGFGNDITKAVTVSYEFDAQDSDTVHYVFTVKNSFNDAVSAEATLTLTRTKPIIVLKESAVTIALHTPFNALEYVSNAEDVDGTSLFTSIIINGNVNTETAGVYTLTYTASSPSGNISDPKELIVTVQ